LSDVVVVAADVKLLPWSFTPKIKIKYMKMKNDMTFILWSQKPGK